MLVLELETGKVQTIVTKRTPFQEAMMDEFVVYSEAIRNNQVALYGRQHVEINQ
nr:hypothetical protein [Enterococcus sp. DIV2402]MBO0463837.1 hypothetical protein [Enterococcus sp. DIV2402]